MKNIFNFKFHYIFIVICSLVMFENYSFGQVASVVSGDSQKPVVVSSKKISSWKTGDSRVFVCLDDVKIVRGDVEISADECVCWFYEDKAFQSDEATIDAYFSGNVSLLKENEVEKHDQMFLRLASTSGVVIESGKAGVSNFEEEQQTQLFNKAKTVKLEAKKSFGKNGSSKGSASVFAVPTSDEVVDIFADEVDSWVDGNSRVITAVGNVRIKRGDMSLNADNVLLRLDNDGGNGFSLDGAGFKEMYAEGNVALRQNNDVQLADKIFMNYKENRGMMINGDIKATFGGEEGLAGSTNKYNANGLSGEVTKGHEEEGVTAYIKGEEIKITGKGMYEINNGEFTTCGFNHPHFKFKSSKIRIIKTNNQTVLSLAGNKLYWGNRPVMYWPYLALDVRSKPTVLENWEIGNSSRYGSFITTDWNLFNLGIAGSVAKWSDLILSLDYLQKRGPGIGVNYDYEKDNIYGKLDTYYINDKKDEELNSVPVEDQDRWRLSWRHRQKLPFDLRLDLEANNLSDSNFLREFYEKVYKEQKDEEAVFYVRKLTDTHSATFLLKKQLNSFDTFVDAQKMERVAERLPEVSYKIIGEPLANGSFNYTTENTFTYFDRVFSNEITNKNPDPEATWRFDSNSEISAPFKFSILKVKPYAKGRFISYSDSVDNKDNPTEFDNNGSRLERVIGTLGVDISTTMWRTYSYYNKFFNINRIRHVFTPEFRYSANPVVTHDPNEVNQFDSVDSINDSQWLLLGFRNKFQTKRGTSGNERVEDLIYFDVELNVFVGDEGEGSVFNNDIVYNKERDNFIQLDFIAKVNDNITIVSHHNELNLSTGSFDVFNVGVAADYNERLNGFLGHRFIEGISSSLLFSTNYSLSDKWELGFSEQFDFRARPNPQDEDFKDEGDTRDRGRNLKTKLVLSRYFHEWMGSLTTEFNPVRDETITRFDIFPKTFKKKNNASRFWF